MKISKKIRGAPDSVPTKCPDYWGGYSLNHIILSFGKGDQIGLTLGILITSMITIGISNSYFSKKIFKRKKLLVRMTSNMPNHQLFRSLK